jgi:TldD protein
MTDRSLIEEAGIGVSSAARILDEALAGAEDGEIYVESVRSESFLFDDGRLKSASYDSGQGFGLRVVSGETTGYAHASEISEAALRRAATSAAAAKRGRSNKLAMGPTPVNRRLYADVDPTASPDFVTKTGLLAEIDAWCRASDPRVVQVSVSLAGSRTAVEIIRSGGASVTEARPLVRVNIAVTMEKDGRRETGSAGAGGRAGYEGFVRSLKRDIVDGEIIQAVPSQRISRALRPAAEGGPSALLDEAAGV